MLFRVALALCWAPTVSTFAPVAEHKSVMLGLSVGFQENARQPTVTMDTQNRIVLVFVSGDQLYYSIGTSDKLVVEWMDKQLVAEANNNGQWPSVSMNSKGNIALVYEHAAELFHRHGQVTHGDRTVTWGPAVSFGKGTKPSIALADDGTFVEVHQESEQSFTLMYHTGHIRDGKIELDKAIRLTDDGASPRVAMNSKLQAVVVYQLGGTHQKVYKLHSISGTVANGQATWQKPFYFAKGDSPSVSLNNEGIVTAVYENDEDKEKLISRMGTFEGTEVIWSETKEAFESGDAPQVAASNHQAIVIQERENSLKYSVSLIIDRSRWMENEVTFHQLPIWKLSLPASHDSGAYNMKREMIRASCANTKGIADLLGGEDLSRKLATAGNRNMYQQLRGGIRFFDIRPYFWKKRHHWLNGKEGDDQFYTYHENLGDSMKNILDHLARFMAESKRELVVLSVTNFCKKNFDTATHDKLIALIEEKIGKFLFNRNTEETNLLKTTLGEYVKDGSKVLVVYEDKLTGYTVKPNRGIWPTQKWPMYHKYANQDDRKDMENDQAKKIRDHAGTEKEIFQLFYTQTFKIDISKSLHKLSKQVNPFLAQFIKKHAYDHQINVISVDFFQDSRVTDVAIMLNHATARKNGTGSSREPTTAAAAPSNSKHNT